jgi:xanthine dehydrogenase YagS FAD-binding subunit
MQAFEYANPATLQEALALLGSKWGEADVLAGGTDLISLMKDGVHTPKRVVNIKSIKELGGVGKAGAGIRIGATATIDELLESSAAREYTALTDAARSITGAQMRNMGTVGGDLCQRPRCWYFRTGYGLLGMKDGQSLVAQGDNRYHSIFGSGPAHFVSASLLAPALIAFGAKATVVSAKGKREIPLAEFFVTPSSADQREIALQPDEILTEIVVPPTSGLRSATYEVREREAMDWPLVAASVALRMEGSKAARGHIVLGHVAPVPYIAKAGEGILAGREVNEKMAEDVAKAVVADAKPLSQNAYKVQLARVAVKRAILKAAGLLKV